MIKLDNNEWVLSIIQQLEINCITIHCISQNTACLVASITKSISATVNMS